MNRPVADLHLSTHDPIGKKGSGDGISHRRANLGIFRLFFLTEPVRQKQIQIRPDFVFSNQHLAAGRDSAHKRKQMQTTDCPIHKTETSQLKEGGQFHLTRVSKDASRRDVTGKD